MGVVPFGPGGQMIPVPLGHECAGEVAEHQERFARLISHRIPFSEVRHAYDLALTLGAAEKVIVTMDGRQP